MATANPVQLGPSPSGPVRGAGPTFLKLGITFRARGPRSQLALQLGLGSLYTIFHS